MAEEQHEPETSAVPDAAPPTAASDEVVEAELIESDPTIVESDPSSAEPDPIDVEPDPAAQANESLAAAAAAAGAAATGEAPAQTATPADEWQLGEPSVGQPPQYVVVEAPQPPLARGNRGIGTLLALAGAVVYGGLLVGIAYLLEVAEGTPGVGFLQDWHFYLPVIVFAVVFVLLVLLVNRAGWWSYILGSLVVGLAVYAGTAGGDALIDQWNRVAEPHTMAAGLATPFVILAGIVAREVTVWWGSLIAWRGRRVTARNRVARDAYERDLADFRARYGG